MIHLCKAQNVFIFSFSGTLILSCRPPRDLYLVGLSLSLHFSLLFIVHCLSKFLTMYSSLKPAKMYFLFSLLQPHSYHILIDPFSWHLFCHRVKAMRRTCAHWNMRYLFPFTSETKCSTFKVYLFSHGVLSCGLLQTCLSAEEAKQKQKRAREKSWSENISWPTSVCMVLARAHCASWSC